MMKSTHKSPVTIVLDGNDQGESWYAVDNAAVKTRLDAVPVRCYPVCHPVETAQQELLPG